MGNIVFIAYSLTSHLQSNGIAHTNTNVMYRPNVMLLPAVWSSTVEPLNGAGLEPANQDGGNTAM